MKTVGVDLPNYKCRDIIDDFKRADKNHDGKLSLEEFQEVNN